MDERNEIMLFKNDDFGSIRVTTPNDEVWFVGNDIAQSLGYAKPRNAILAHVDDDDRRTAPIWGLSGKKRRMTIINESGLYSLIFASQLPSSKKFKHWITSVVLPAVRKRDQRKIDEATNGLNVLMDIVNGTWTPPNKTKPAIVDNKSISYKDYVAMIHDNQPITVIAKDYGWTARKMNEFLRERGVQYKSENLNAWILTPKYDKGGIAVTNTFTCQSYTATHTYWTPAGRLFIYDLMKQAGYKPIIEQEHHTAG